jgi:hypothetical protein
MAKIIIIVCILFYFQQIGANYCDITIYEHGLVSVCYTYDDCRVLTDFAYEWNRLERFDDDLLVIIDREVDSASANNNIDVLDKWRNSSLEWNESCTRIKTKGINGKTCGHNDEMYIVDYSMRLVQAHGCDNLTKELYNSDLFYTTLAMDYASANGHTNILEWWKNSGFELKYTKFAMNMAAIMNNIEILDWWINSDLELKYDISAMKMASEFDQPEHKTWWTEHSFLYSK